MIKDVLDELYEMDNGFLEIEGRRFCALFLKLTLGREEMKKCSRVSRILASVGFSVRGNK